MTSPTRRYTTNQAAQTVGISKSTLLEWLRKGHVREPRMRDRNGWRVWTDDDLTRVIAHRDRTHPAPERPLRSPRARVPEEATR